MNTQELITKLKNSNLYAECICGEEFKMSDAFLFDGTKPFPPEAKELQDKLKASLKEREEDLKKRKKRASEGAQVTAKAVNIGKKLEVIFPTIKDFKWVLPDCRFMAEPIDMITFNGLSTGKVESISFIEIKSGAAKLNAHQKSVKDAIEDKKVSYKVFK